MKLVTAILQPATLSRVLDVLSGFGVSGLTVSGTEEVTGELRVEVYRAHALVSNTAARIRLEVVVADEDAPDVVRIIVSAGRAAHGDPGRVWTQTILEVVRIRTRERGLSAL
jgi:nitrogen regulatory protein P-II 1